MLLDSTKFAPGFAAPIGHHAAGAARHPDSQRFTGKKMTFADVKAGKLSTHVETADQFVDDLVATARRAGTERAKRAADVLEKWDRAGGSHERRHVAVLSVSCWPPAADFQVDRRLCRADRRSPAADDASWVCRSGEGRRRARRGGRAKWRRSTARCTCCGATCSVSAAATIDLPGNGAPSAMGAIRTVNPGPFVERQSGGRRRRYLFRRDRVLQSGACGGAAQLRQLVEDRLGARRGSDAAAVEEGDAAGLARLGRRLRPISRAGRLSRPPAHAVSGPAASLTSS